jgi:RNA polymerase sigma-70 factor (ECF subfamily)
VQSLAPGLVRELRRLPTVDRDTLLLVIWGELSYAEAALALQVPVGTVRSRIARARDRLSHAIGADGFTGAGVIGANNV